MFVNVGRFRFRPMGQDEQQSLMQRIHSFAISLKRPCK
jgi:hypothetical protein